jgi:uracil-DNA glycosylase
MQKIKQIIERAKTGNHPACKDCLRNPQSNKTAFAYCCDEHFGMNKNGLVIILRDPGASDGGASHSGSLCPFHNNDATAKRLQLNLPALNVPYKSIYFLNAILHGYFDINSKSRNEAERKCCKIILEEIINCLQPKIILALGLEALQSSLEILTKSGTKKPTMKEMVKISFSYGQISDVSVFALPHPAYARVNLGRYGLSETEVWAKVAKEINKIMTC